jgi:cystathionine beta-lyase
MIKLINPQGTYLVWLDFKALNLTRRELGDLIVGKANLWLDPGHIFGKDGEGFERINIACPRETLKKALDQLTTAING